MRKTLSVTMAAALAGFVAAPVLVHADETIERRYNSESEHTTVESAPAPVVRERTEVETAPAAPMQQRRDSETIVKKGGHDSDHKTKVESKTKIKDEDED